MARHTFESDTQRLIQFAKDQGFDSAYLMQAVNRLEYAINEELSGYSIPPEDNEPVYGE